MEPFPGLPVVVRSTHVDFMGHVSHMAYLEFMEWARLAWADHVGAPIPQLIQQDRMGPALIKIEVRYRKECHLGDALRVHVTPLSVRRKLGRLYHTIVREQTNELAAEAWMTFAMIDMDTRSLRELPPAWLDAIENWQPTEG